MKRTPSRYQKGSLTKFKNEGGREVWVFRWRETKEDGKRCPRKIVVGSVKDLPTERLAWLAVDALDLNINHDLSMLVRAPRTVVDLIRHYESTELADDSDSVARSTKDVYKVNLKNWIEAKWGYHLLGELEALPGVYVENWLKTLKKADGKPLTPGTKAKLRNILSALCSHAVRYGWMKTHPIKGKVRQSAKATRVQVPLEIGELRGLYAELGQRERVMLLLVALDGLRRGEQLVLQWRDFNLLRRPSPFTGAFGTSTSGQLRRRKVSASCRWTTR